MVEARVNEEQATGAVALQPIVVLDSPVEAVLGEGVQHASEWPRGVVAEEEKQWFPARRQLLKSFHHIFVCDLGMRLPDNEEWLLAENQGSPFDSSRGPRTPSLPRRGFQFEWRVARYRKPEVG